MGQVWGSANVMLPGCTKDEEANTGKLSRAILEVSLIARANVAAKNGEAVLTP